MYDNDIKLDIVIAKVNTLQVLANGFLFGPHTYLRSSWNIMDGSLIVMSLFDVAVSLSAAQGQRNSLGILRVFRLLRTLRPLRFVKFVVCRRSALPKLYLFVSKN